MRARLLGGMLNKAHRGELQVRLPVGLVYGLKDQVILDPDHQVQQSLHLFFRTFRRMGTIQGTVKEFGRQGFLFPESVSSNFQKTLLCPN